MSFWSVTFSRSVPEEFPSTFDEFLSDNGIGKIFDCLDINSQPSVNQSITWMEWIQKNHFEWMEISNRFLGRHSANADPELYKLIHAFVESTLMKTIPIMTAIKTSRDSNDPNQTKSLSHFLPKPKKSDYDVLHKMHKCLKSLNKKYNRDNLKSEGITNYKPVKLAKRKVDCAIIKQKQSKVLSK